MLFFKQIQKEKHADQSFDTLYARECHICPTTIKLIALLEAENDKLPQVLDQAGISRQDYDLLKSGDLCRPEQVRKLCDALDLQEIRPSENCKRASSKNQI